MRPSAKVIAIALAWAAGAAAQPAMVHRDFAAAFPAAPVVQTDGPIVRYVDDEMNVVFEVDVVTAGPEAARGGAADQLRLQAFGRRNDAAMRSSGAASLAGQPAAEAVFVSGSGAVATARTTAHDGRGYVVVYRHAQDQGSDSERDGFLNSFRFTP